MGQDISYEDPNKVFFITAKTQHAKLWFINNRKLHERMRAYLAKYQEELGVIIHGFIIMGNHYHLLARFPNSNKAAFKRNFHSVIAGLTLAHVELYEGGTLWGGRSKDIPCPRPEDVLHWFFYLTLNPIHSGLVQRISEFNSYNSFFEAVQDVRNKYEVVNWEKVNRLKKRGRKVLLAEHTKVYTLIYTRLPGYEEMAKREYVKFMHREVAERAIEAVEKRISEGKGFCGRQVLKSIEPGTKPEETKKRKRGERTRPLVLTLCEETRREFLEWYFQRLESYREASRRYRAGEHEVVFPAGTYRPRLQEACPAC